MAQIQDYLNLVTAEHDTKPNFLAVLAAILQPLVDEQNVLAALPSNFDVDLAIGAQLDVVGQWVGVSRKLAQPISGVYFAFDTANVGWDEGVWFDPFDPTEGIISLDDQTYRLVIYFKIAANVWDGTLKDAESILSSILLSTNPGTHIFIQDNMNMSIDLGISGVVPSILFQSLLTTGSFQVRPAAVNVDAVFINPGPFFGFDTENFNISGFDVGFWE